MVSPGSDPARNTVIARALLASALGLFGLWLIFSFLPSLIWAVIIAVAIDPLYVRAAQRWPGRGGRSMLAAAITIGIALLVIVPAVIGIRQAAHEAYEVAAWIAAARTNGIPAPDWLQRLPVGSAEIASWWQANLATPQGAAEQLHHWSSATLMAHSRLIGSGLLHRAVIFTFTLVSLFFLLRERDEIIRQLSIAGERLLGPAGERIGRQTIRSVRGTIDGLVLVGIGEGVVMTIVYLLLGVPHPLLLGAITVIAAMIPFGAAVLFGIAALLLLAQGSVGGAIAVVVAGLLVVAIADHFIRPVLIGSATRLPFLWVLIGILGGVETLGLLGLFVGPATMAILIMLWREFIDGPLPPPAAALLDLS
jgi:predicted PurR-regulated permease PerM